ncbi:hypothetical protein IQ07DRAFT_276182 [Pyrenochaeta sp. DS3sAY3a]|nr:hypothetical protein IQ07DRAFT_276182 [Pyrenochaeta sp. DS3sAY3a]
MVLKAIREFRARDDAKSHQRPIIVVAHSLGGLIFKEAMFAALETDNEFLNAIYAVELFGVPNLGLQHKILLSEVDGKPCDQLARDIVVNEGKDPTTYLEHLRKRFGEEFTGKYKIDVFYERKDSELFKADQHGNKTIPDGMIRKVTLVSARDVGVSPDLVQPLVADHVGLVRFANDFEQTYTVVRDHILERAREAPKIIAERFRVGEWGEAEKGKAKKIMEALDFPSIDFRRQAVSQAAWQTYDWMISNGGDAARTSEQNRLDPGLSKWFAEGNGIFWISGKSGSGKSTLMKSVYEHGVTPALLSTWASGSRLMIAKHHFWYPGKTLQKSYEGFARTILKGILEVDPTITKWVFLKQMASDADTISKNFSRADLDGALLNLGDAPVKICLFIDALDECDPREDQQSVVDTICTLAKLKNVKICVSSRRWKNFEEAFQAVDALRLEEINRLDIETYVGTAIRKSIASRTEFKKGDKDFAHAIQDLEFDIAEKSAGVFLWVNAVTRQITDRLRIGQDVDVVRKFVGEFPEDITDYYKDMIYKRISSTWRGATTTAQALKLAMLWTECDMSDLNIEPRYLRPPLLVSWWFLATSTAGFEDKNFGIHFPFTVLTLADLRKMYRLTRDFVHTACQDLLQVIYEYDALDEDAEENNDPYSWSMGLWLVEAHVAFASRTAYDFLSSSKELMEMLNEKTPRHLDESFLVQIDMAIAKLTVPYVDDWFEIDQARMYRHTLLDTVLAWTKHPAFSTADNLVIIAECHEVALKYFRHYKGAIRGGLRYKGQIIPPWISKSQSYLISEFLYHGFEGLLDRRGFHGIARFARSKDQRSQRSLILTRSVLT